LTFFNGGFEPPNPPSGYATGVSDVDALNSSVCMRLNALFIGRPRACVKRCLQCLCEASVTKPVNQLNDVIISSHFVASNMANRCKWTSRPTFLPRDAILVRYMLSSCVRLSVRPSQVGVLRRLLNLGSRIQRRTIAQDSSLLMPKISAKLQRGRQTEIEWITIDDFW